MYQAGLSRQAAKTLEAVKAEESIPTHLVINLLEGLGFRRTVTGSHQNWRHPKGYRCTFVRRKQDEGIWGRELKALRILIEQIEAKEYKEEENPVAMQFEKTREKMSGAEVREAIDAEVLSKQQLKPLNRLDLTVYNQQQQAKALSDAFNEMTAYMTRLGSMVQSTQEYLIEMGVKLDNVSARTPEQAITVQTRKFQTPEELQAFRKKQGAANMEKLHKERLNKKLTSLKELQKQHSQWAKNASVLAALSGIGVKTVEGYFAKELL